MPHLTAESLQKVHYQKPATKVTKITHEVFFPNVKLLLVVGQFQFLFLGYLIYTVNRVTRGIKKKLSYVLDFLVLQIIPSLSECGETERRRDHQEDKWDSEQTWILPDHLV